jgi:hypothetical protein
MKYPEKIREYLDVVERTLSPTSNQIASNGIALLLLAGDTGIERYVGEVYGESIR